MSNPNFNNLLSTTLKYYSKTLAENLPEASPLLKALKTKYNIKVDGGSHIVLPLEYATNSTATSFAGTDTFSLSDDEKFTSAEYNWKFYNVSIVVTDQELAQNSGKEQIINLLDAKIRNAERSLHRLIGTHLYQDGTGNNGKNILGLGAIVSETPDTGTVGGINAATATYWRNYAENQGGNVTPWGDSNLRGLKAIDKAYVEIRARGGNPAIIVCGKTAFNALRTEIRIKENFVNIGGKKEPEIGFADFVLLGMPVVFDNQCPDNKVYILDTEYLKLYVLNKLNFVVIPSQRALNQAVHVSHIRVGLQLCCSNRSVQGVLFNISAA